MLTCRDVNWWGTTASSRGDPIFGEPEVMAAENTLGFAGIAPPMLRVYPVEVLRD